MTQALLRLKRWPQHIKETHVHHVACTATMAGGAFILQQRHKLLPSVNGFLGGLVQHDALHCFKNSCAENEDSGVCLPGSLGSSTRLCQSLMQMLG